MNHTETLVETHFQELLEELASLAGDPLASGTTNRQPHPKTPLEPLHVPSRGEELTSMVSEVAADDASAANEELENFMPAAPRSLADTGLTECEVEAIILRLFLLRGTNTGLEISQQVALPFGITEKILHALKAQRLLVFKGPATLNDYAYELTEAGIHRARRYAEQCTYCSSAPVSLADYAAGVAAQSVQRARPRIENLRRAFADLTLSEEMFFRLGRAITSGRGLFLYGPPGNGKTSIAQRITAVFGRSIWIPRAISAWGEIIRLFDPACHEELPLTAGDRSVDEERLDLRWVRICRPTIVVGGELTMDSLDITVHKDTNVSEAPMQMKSNCGTLVIDDFGRQRVSPATLLNRWIVPLETRHDYLGLASGRKIKVPFDQFTVFATNLEPKDLVDEAFLRRIPYKIDVENPTEAEFRQLFSDICQEGKIGYCEDALNHLIDKHYRAAGRAMRFCHPRDLLHQVAVYCKFLDVLPTISSEALDAAAKDYFSMV